MSTNTAVQMSAYSPMMMKRIRRRPNRNNSSGMVGMRRSISHPASRRESLVPAIAGSGEDEIRPLLMGDGSIQLDAGGGTDEDIEAAGSSEPTTNSESDKKNDDALQSGTSTTTNTTRQQLQIVRQRLYHFWQTIPPSLKTVLVLHASACTFSLWCIYYYWRFHVGFYTAWLLMMLVASLFGASTLAAFRAARSATTELQTLLDQEGRSRAILNTLYPARVLEQMYMELQPEQIEEAQHQQASQRFLEQSLNHMSSRSFLDLAPEVDSPVPPAPSLKRARSGPSSSRRLSLKSGPVFRKQLSFERKQETGEIDVVVVEVDRQKLGYEDNSNTKNINTKKGGSTSTTETQTTAITADSTSTDEIVCIRRNSLSLRRRSMITRANSQKDVTNSPTQASTMIKRVSMGFHKGTPLKRRSSVGSTRSASSNASSQGKPIQEKFAATTVLFADISGFTQWCSEREPCHVFHLLENVFFAFDNLAKNLKVYKIETIGDCYVAVTGIPQPLDAHAAAMALFASQIILEFDMVVAELAANPEEEGGLGGDTAKLRLRVGCHSGPVTAGVLRGDKGRFQLFGDTVNTAARMESNGLPGKVQISQEMANALIQDGKSNWYRPRPDRISAKGKGELNTYWLNDDLLGQLKLQQQDGTDKPNKSERPPKPTQLPPPPSKQPTTAPLSNKSDTPPSRPKRQSLVIIPTYDEEPIHRTIHRNTAEQQRRLSQDQPSMWLKLEKEMSAPEQKLAKFNYEQLEILVKKIVAHHTASQMDASANDWGNTDMMMDDCWGEQPLQYEEPDGSILEELREASDSNLIPNSNNITVNYERVKLPVKVVVELQKLVKTLETSFQKANPFHNFQHACHMTRSMVQLLDHLERQNSEGILSKDPMAQFVIVFTCMVQDVDNPGVTNDQLIKEDSEMADYFHNTCLQQQNALDVAFELLVGPTCENLLQAICSHSGMELERFRKYMVHAMLATDREDKELSQERFTRWMKVGNPTGKLTKATWQHSIAVIEQCMQLSNLVHTVQTPRIFAKWNERCFREQYLAYIKGRRDEDPCTGFCKEQLELFKRNVIPLAERFQKTQNNSMMGTCEELVDQSKANLEIWKATGKETVKEMAAGAKYEFGERQLDGTIKSTTKTDNG